jgi:hypothetical protein
MAGLFAALQSLVQPPQEVDGAASLVPFGSSPAHSFSLAAGACRCIFACAWRGAQCCVRRAAGSLPGPAVLHVYGEPTKSLQSPLSSIEVRRRRVRAGSQRRETDCSAGQVGTPIPPDKRLKFAAELFDVVDVYGERQLDAQKLQVLQRAHCGANTGAQATASRARAGCAAGVGAATPSERRVETLRQRGRPFAAGGARGPSVAQWRRPKP